MELLPSIDPVHEQNENTLHLALFFLLGQNRLLSWPEEAVFIIFLEGATEQVTSSVLMPL